MVVLWLCYGCAVAVLWLIGACNPMVCPILSTSALFASLGIYTIAISALTEHEGRPYYSENCAAALTSTYSSGGGRAIVTVDLHNRCMSFLDPPPSPPPVYPDRLLQREAQILAPVSVPASGSAS